MDANEFHFTLYWGEDEEEGGIFKKLNIDVWIHYYHLMKL